MNIDPLRQIYRKTTNKDKPPALLGNGQGLVTYPYLPNTVYVMVPTSVGYLQATALLPSSVIMSLTPNQPVRLGYDEKGRRVVLGGDGDAIAAQGGSTVGQLQAVLSPSAPQTNFQTLNLVAKTGLLVSLRGWNVISAGVYTEAQYPDIDLTAHVPAAAGGIAQQRYVGIFVKADFTDVELVDSTPRGVSDLPLGVSDVNEILAAATVGDTPAWCVKLITGQTQVTQSDIQTDAQDLRQAINGPDATNGKYVLKAGDTMTGPLIGTTVTENIYKLPAVIQLTESSDAITITQGYHTVHAETGTTDNLATINGGSGNQQLTLQAKSTDTITVKNGTGNIFLNGGADFALSGDKTLLLFYDGTNWSDVGAGGGGGGSGTVTSVALTVPSRQTVAGSPVTTSGTLAITDNTQSASQVFAGPSSGSAAAPTFRALVAGDLPASSSSKDLYVATASGTVASTTSETTIIGSGVGSLTLPANFLTVGKALRVRVLGVWGTTIVAPTINIKFKLGSTVIVATGAVTAPTSLSNQWFEVIVELTCRTTGASGTVIAQGAFLNAEASATFVAFAYPMSETSTNTVDTTGTLAVDVTATWGTSNAANTITATNAVLQSIDTGASANGAVAAVYHVRATSSVVVNPDPISDTLVDSMTLTFTLATTSYVVVTYTIIKTAAHSDRYNVYESASILTSHDYNDIVNHEGFYQVSYTGVFQLSSGSRTINITERAETSTASITFVERSLVVQVLS